MINPARIVKSAMDKSLVIFNEIGGGTSNFNGLSIARNVDEHLHDHLGDGHILFATHHSELTELDASRKAVQNDRVAVREWVGRREGRNIKSAAQHRIASGALDPDQKSKPKNSLRKALAVTKTADEVEPQFSSFG